MTAEAQMKGLIPSRPPASPIVSASNPLPAPFKGSPLRRVLDPRIEREERAGRRRRAAADPLSRSRPRTVGGRLRLVRKMGRSLRGAGVRLGLSQCGFGSGSGSGDSTGMGLGSDRGGDGASRPGTAGTALPATLPAPLGVSYDFMDYFRATRIRR